MCKNLKLIKEVIYVLPFESFIKNRLSEKRFKHSVNVAKAARWLAFKYEANDSKAVIAGILHDLTKEWKTHDHLMFLQKYNIGVTKYEYGSKKLFHAITASIYAKAILRITDIDILNAIRFHTTARPKMSKLEKIVYLADFISDDRNFSGVDRLRALASINLDDAVFAGLSYTIKELSDDSKVIHPNTINAYNEFVLNRERENSIKSKNDDLTKYISFKPFRESVRA